jgi:hypothetical protein
VIRRPAHRLLLLPLAIWTAHVAVGFGLVSLRCNRGTLNGEVAGIDTVRLILIGITAVTAVLLLMLASASLRLWRIMTASEDPTGARRLLFLLATLMCGLALLYLTWATILTNAGGVCE